MKIKSLLAGMVVSAALASCTNQDIIENESEINTSTAKAYIGIKIADPANGISRAATDGGFDNGTINENYIKKSLFVFYDKDGNNKGKGIIEGKLDVNGNPVNGTSIEANTTAVVVLHGVQGKNDYPTQVVAFLNLPQEVQTELEGKKLDEAIEMVKNMTEISDYATNENFIMTNSVYLKEDKIQVATPITNINFAQTEEGAIQNPITIYVERVAAKVKMTEKQDGVETPDIDIIYNGKSGYKLKLEIDGWGINGVNKSTYILKNVDATWNWNNWIWNDVDNHRSYWAKDSNYDNGNYPINHEEYDSNAYPLVYNSWNTVAGNVKNIQYCPENTVGPSLLSNINATTYMVIAGHYKIVDKNGTENEVGESNKLYQYIGQFYTEEELLKLLAEQASIYTQTEKKWNKVGADSYQLVRANLHEAKLELKTEGEYYSEKNESKKITSLKEANSIVNNRVGTITTFAGGKTFFYTNIQHLNTNTGKVGSIGIVRNHTYNLTLNTIRNLGEGVFDPDEEIIITDKEKEFFVGATLNILSWKVVNQDVDL